MYKLFVVDVDGTLVDVFRKHPKHYSDDWYQRISDDVLSGLKKADSMGLWISLCTGRSYFEIDKILKRLNLSKNMHVVESGTKVINDSGTPYYTYELSIDLVLEIVEKTKGNYYDFVVCRNGIWVRNLEELKLVPEGITSIALKTNNHQSTEMIEDSLGDLLKDKIFVSYATNSMFKSGDSVMISPAGISKSTGITFIQNKLNIKKEETIGIGDMENDIPIFQSVGLKCAIGGGDESILSKADYIASSVEKDGVLDVLNKFVFT